MQRPDLRRGKLKSNQATVVSPNPRGHVSIYSELNVGPTVQPLSPHRSIDTLTVSDEKAGAFQLSVPNAHGRGQ